MKGYRFITDDDTSEFCHRVKEALSSGWKLYGEPQMMFDKKKVLCDVIKLLLKILQEKNIQKK